MIAESMISSNDLFSFFPVCENFVSLIFAVCEEFLFLSIDACCYVQTASTSHFLSLRILVVSNHIFYVMGGLKLATVETFSSSSLLLSL
jgi:hypothetical protein